MSELAILVNIVSSAGIAFMLAANMYRASWQTKFERTTYMLMISVPAAIALKMIHEWATGADIKFDPYGVAVRVVLLLWLMSNYYAAQRDGVAVMWCRNKELSDCLACLIKERAEIDDELKRQTKARKEDLVVSAASR